MREDFGILIMSYGRPDNVKTLSSLLKSNYTGKWFIVIGDDDPAIEGYKAKFGEQCIVFNKDEYIAKSDRMGLKITKVIMFARNACFDIAESLGLTYFQQLDDDYTSFHFAFDNKMEYCNKLTRVNYDHLINAMLLFFISCPNTLLGMSFLQGGDFIGGVSQNDRWAFTFLRKCMNGWLCSTERRFLFQGVMNEDVSAYTNLQTTGSFFLTLSQIRLQQPITQTTGGMTAMYKQYGTHVKSFLSVMLNPSFCKVSVLTNKQQRLHHRIDWKKCGAKIIRDTHVKGDRKTLIK
tara:strand:- start:1601 stop:2476 length:876 start_codon:yes stop_codon:yes gene_type:complete